MFPPSLAYWGISETQLTCLPTWGRETALIKNNNYLSFGRKSLLATLHHRKLSGTVNKNGGDVVTQLIGDASM